MSKAGGGSAGFVLAEALIAVMLTAMTVSLFAAMLTFGRRVSDTGRERDRLVAMAAGTDALSGWLGGAVAVKEAPGGPDASILFDGQGGRLTFITISNGDAQPGGLMAVTVAFEGRARALVFDAAPLAIGSASLPSGGARQVLWGNVLSLRFSYFGASADGAPVRWHDEWQNAARLPRLVALRAGLEVNRQVEIVDLTFRIASE